MQLCQLTVVSKESKVRKPCWGVRRTRSQVAQAPLPSKPLSICHTIKVVWIRATTVAEEDSLKETLTQGRNKIQHCSVLARTKTKAHWSARRPATWAWWTSRRVRDVSWIRLATKMDLCHRVPASTMLVTGSLHILRCHRQWLTSIRIRANPKCLRYRCLELSERRRTINYLRSTWTDSMLRIQIGSLAWSSQAVWEGPNHQFTLTRTATNSSLCPP